MERYPLFKRFGYFDKEYLHFIPYGDIIHNNQQYYQTKINNDYEKINFCFCACI